MYPSTNDDISASQLWHVRQCQPHFNQQSQAGFLSPSRPDLSLRSSQQCMLLTEALAHYKTLDVQLGLEYPACAGSDCAN